MNTEILGVVVQIALMVILAYPLGKYIAKVYRGEKTWSDFMAPIERVIYKVCGIDPNEEMNWKQFLKALLILNAFWFFWGMVLLVSQGWLPLNPDGNGPQGENDSGYQIQPIYMERAHMSRNGNNRIIV